MKSFVVIVISLLLTSSASKLIKTKVADGIVVSLPAALMPMPPDDIAQRYPSVRAPLGAYTNLDRDVDFSVNISATNWPDGNVEMAQGFFKSSLYNLYDRVDMMNEGIQVIRKKKFIFFEFESRISGNARKQGQQDPVLRYTYVQYLLQPKRTLVFTFTCTKNQQEEWQETAKEIMKSIKVN